MTKASESGNVRGRVERIGREIDTLRVQSAQRNLPQAATRELADMKSRHKKLHRRLDRLEAQAKPEHYIAGALAADLEGLVEAVSRWIARQDMKAARH